MPRTRIISQSKALFVSPTGNLPTSYGTPIGANPSGLVPTQLNRVDTFSFDVDLAGGRQDIREFGQLARIGTIRIGELTPTLSFGYYLTEGNNEHNLGFSVKGLNPSTNPPTAVTQFISGVLAENPVKREKNLYVLTAAEGTDAFDSAGYASSLTRANHDVIAFGNATLSSYGVKLAVGEIPRADVEMECGNIVFYPASSSGLANPSVIRQTAVSADTGKFIITAPSTGFGQVDVLKPGDVRLNFSNNTAGFGGIKLSGIAIQSASIDIPLSRSSIEALGSALPFAKPLEFPINVTCAINGIVQDFTSGSLQSILTGCVAGSNTDISISIADRCNSGTTRMAYLFKNAVLDSNNFSIGLDDNETVDLTFSAQIAGATTTTAGVFMSGSFAGINVTGQDSEKPAFFPLA
jgi:hypothetical protein